MEKLKKTRWLRAGGSFLFSLTRPQFPALCEQIRAQGGLAVAAHPVSTRKWEKQTYALWNRREELRDCFDAWEVASGPRSLQSFSPVRAAARGRLSLA